MHTSQMPAKVNVAGEAIGPLTLFEGAFVGFLDGVLLSILIAIRKQQWTRLVPSRDWAAKCRQIILEFLV